jgi:hypothetical protein
MDCSRRPSRGLLHSGIASVMQGASPWPCAVLYTQIMHDKQTRWRNEHSTLNTQHSTLNAQHSKLNIERSTSNAQRRTKRRPMTERLSDRFANEILASELQIAPRPASCRSPTERPRTPALWAHVSSGELSVQARFFISATRASRLQEQAGSDNRQLRLEMRRPRRVRSGLRRISPGRRSPELTCAPALLPMQKRFARRGTCARFDPRDGQSHPERDKRTVQS